LLKADEMNLGLVVRRGAVVSLGRLAKFSEFRRQGRRIGAAAHALETLELELDVGQTPREPSFRGGDGRLCQRPR
jgi:hypothetical protein